MTKKNIPYVKQFNELGELTNPITPKKPYLSPYANRRQRRMRLSAK